MAKVHSEVEWRQGELQSIYELAEAVARAASLDEVCREAVRAVRQALGVSRASLLLSDEAGTMRFCAWEGLSDQYRQATEGHSPWASDEHDPQPVTIADAAADESLGELRATVLEEGIGSLAFVPLIGAGRHLLGKFMLYFDEPHDFTEAELKLTQAVASYIAIEIQRLRTEFALRASRDQLEAVLRNVPEGISVQDASGRVIFANETAARVLGFDSPAEMTAGAETSELVRSYELLDEDGKPLTSERLPGRRVLAGELSADAIVGWRTRGTGEERWSHVQAQQVGAGWGEARFAVNVFRDITDERMAERRQRFLSRASEVLATSLELDETLQQLASVVVPELADWCVVHLLVGDQLRAAAIAHADEEKEAQAREISSRYPPRTDPDHGVMRVLGTGRSELVHEISDEMLVDAARDDEHLELLRQVGMRSAMTVPIKVERSVLGAITFISAESGHRFNDKDVSLAEELASRAGLAIHHARLHAAERAAREEAEGAERRLAALESLSLAGLRAETTEDVLEALLDRARRALRAERAAVLLLDAETQELRIYRSLGLSSETIEEVRVPLGSGVAGAIAARDAPMVIGDLSKVPVVSRYLREAGGSLVGAPLHVHGRVAGVVHVSTTELNQFGKVDVDLLVALADRVSLIFEQTELRERERSMIETLQLSLLPERLPELDGISFAAHYQPGSEELEIGGDWYDAVVCQDGTLAFAVGDVVGKGLAAAAAMGQMRNALRAYSFVGHEPGDTLRLLDELLASVGTPTFATVFTGKLDLEKRQLVYASAGHPPALLLHDGDVIALDDAQAIPLGVGDFDVSQGEHRLSDGDLVLAYTDGLVERHDRPIGVGIDKLIESLREPAESCSAVIRQVLDALLDEVPEDDVALLALRLLPN